MRYRNVAKPEELVERGRRWIVAIGIDRYESWRPLNNAVSDARGALRAFERLGFSSLCPPLLDGLATAEALRRLARDDLAKLHVNDELIVFFAGHGHTTTTRFGDGGMVTTGYLLPVDAQAPGPGRSMHHWIRLDAWLGDVARSPARHVLVVLDACHSGVALGSLVKWRDAGARQEPLASLARRRSRRIVTSALDDQLAMDSGPIEEHSLFTGCLVEALEGAIAAPGELVTGSELGLYLQRRVSSYPGSRQTPDFGAFEEDRRGELVIQLAAEPPAAAAPEVDRATDAGVERQTAGAAARLEGGAKRRRPAPARAESAGLGEDAGRRRTDPEQDLIAELFGRDAPEQVSRGGLVVGLISLWATLAVVIWMFVSFF
jgi:uncharacterized caspase-like protein